MTSKDMRLACAPDHNRGSHFNVDLPGNHRCRSSAYHRLGRPARSSASVCIGLVDVQHTCGRHYTIKALASRSFQAEINPLVCLPYPLLMWYHDMSTSIPVIHNTSSSPLEARVTIQPTVYRQSQTVPIEQSDRRRHSGAWTDMCRRPVVGVAETPGHVLLTRRTANYVNTPQ